MFGSSELDISQFYKTTKHDTKSYSRTVGHVASFVEGVILSSHRFSNLTLVQLMPQIGGLE